MEIMKVCFYFIFLLSNKRKIKYCILFFQIESSKIPWIVGISIGSILLLLVIAIIIATIIYIRRQKLNSDKKQSNEKISNEYVYYYLK